VNILSSIASILKFIRDCKLKNRAFFTKILTKQKVNEMDKQMGVQITIKTPTSKNSTGTTDLWASALNLSDKLSALVAEVKSPSPGKPLTPETAAQVLVKVKNFLETMSKVFHGDAKALKALDETYLWKRGIDVAEK
jgi:hypothetical protein